MKRKINFGLLSAVTILLAIAGALTSCNGLVIAACIVESFVCGITEVCDQLNLYKNETSF